MQFSDPLIVAYFIVVAGIIGLVVGSFVNCWAWRSVHGESVMRGRSHCTSCGHALAARDLVPVLSWLASRGRCRYCKAKVSARYPVTELLCAAVFASIAAVYGLSAEAIELFVFALALLFLSLTDLDSYVIPNGCIVVALAARVAYLAFAFATGGFSAQDVAYYVASGAGVGAAMVVLVLVADRVFGRESMGGGDLKLYAVAGLYFGWQQSLLLVVLSCIIGITVALLSPAPAKEGAGEPEAEGDDAAESESVMKRAIPFGPSIAAACVIVMLAGTPFIDWYASLGHGLMA